MFSKVASFFMVFASFSFVQAAYFQVKVFDLAGKETHFHGFSGSRGPTNKMEITIDAQGLKVLVKGVSDLPDLKCDISNTALAQQGVSKLELAQFLKSVETDETVEFVCVYKLKTFTSPVGDLENAKADSFVIKLK